MRIIWSIIGVILQVIGSIFKQTNVLFLGYYLAGTGKTRSLPEYTHDTILNEFATGYQLSTTYMPHTFYGNLYTTLGKAWVREENECIYVKDRYMFYPLCDQSDIHFSDCKCDPDTKVYSSLHRSIHTPQKYTDKLQNSKFVYFHKCIKLGQFAFIVIDIWGIGYEVNDEFWVNKGKPFDIYTEIPINKF